METQRYGWSLPVGRIFGIQIRLHLLFVIYIAVELLRAWSISHRVLEIVAMYLGLLFGSVFLHELGHCFFARRMGGSAESILLWPLGGLARVDVPRNWRANFWCSLGGPLVNFVIAAACIGAIALRGEKPDLNPMHLLTLDWLGTLSLVNQRLLIFNLIPLFPLDGSGIAQAFLWRRMGYVPATLITVRVSKVFAILLGIYGLWISEGTWLVMMAVFCYYMAEQERVLLEMGAGEEGFMGYDFSNGYTSLEASSPRPARRGSFWKRLTRRFSSWRADRQVRREKDEELEVKQKVDTLLEKIAREGMTALSEKEREFLKDASKYYHM